MDKKEIIEKVNQFLIEDIEIDEDLIQPEAHIIKDLGIDSLDIVDIIVLIDDNFGLKLKGEDFKEVSTLAAFYDFIEEKINSQ